MLRSLSSRLGLAAAAFGLLLVLAVPGRTLVRAQSTEITLTQADNHSTQSVSVGTTIGVRLGQSGINWDVSSSDATILQLMPGSQTGDQQGIWTAIAPGQATLTGTGRPQCNAGSACPAFLIGWSATIVVGGGPSGPSSGSSSAPSASYSSGWNLVGGPDGTTFPVPLFAWDSSTGQYQTLSSGTSVTGGRGYWAYIGGPATVTLNGTGAASAQMPIDAGQWAQVADPSGTQPASIAGADAVYTYDPVAGAYSTGMVVQPGQGAWAFSAAGASVQITVVPPGPPGPTQDCGSVNSLGGHVTMAGAQQDEDCFYQAYLACAPATLTARINGVDAGTTHMFSLAGTANACTITDVAQTQVIPRPAGQQMTYTCSGLSENAGGLVFSSCGALGDVTVPSS